MQVLAFCTPARPEWRWRIVNYEGAMVEESYESFRSIAIAVTAGTRRMGEMAAKDLTHGTNSFARVPSDFRNRWRD